MVEGGDKGNVLSEGLRGGLIRIECAYKHSGDFAKLQILIQWLWGEA